MEGAETWLTRAGDLGVPDENCQRNASVDSVAIDIDVVRTVNLVSLEIDQRNHLY